MMAWANSFGDARRLPVRSIAAAFAMLAAVLAGMALRDLLVALSSDLFVAIVPLGMVVAPMSDVIGAAWLLVLGDEGDGGDELS